MFVAERGLSQAAAADLFGCSQGLVSKILRGERTPGLEVAFRIQRATQELRGGSIRAEEWVASGLEPTGTEG